ncbi:MAG: hypothetical protein PHZ02_12145 [Desulfocapsaceae bacterium]|nr:hypothetical protein [Desulfocapsaceae bacterium]
MRSHSVCRIISILIISAFLLFPVATWAGHDKDPECGDPTAWARFTSVVLKQSSLGSTDSAVWKASFDHQTNDILIETDISNSGTSNKGFIAMVGGRIMLSKGIKLDPGYEIDSLDAPVLSIKLLMIVLSRVFPNGPTEVVGSIAIDKNDKTGIKYATPSASGYIPAPWLVKGNIAKASENNLTFDLALTFPIEQRNKNDQKYTLLMAGEFSMLNHAVFLDSQSLNGWTTYGLGPRQIKQPKSTILDYGATPSMEETYKTIGDIRALIAAENHPGYRDTTKDFTGFWKEKCDQAFGLQIMHYGNEGKYSVVFCGPGGCGEPSESRLTFITEDKHWEVINEDKLIQIGRSGDRDTYIRCTKETNPVLKYTK